MGIQKELVAATSPSAHKEYMAGMKKVRHHRWREHRRCHRCPGSLALHPDPPDPSQRTTSLTTPAAAMSQYFSGLLSHRELALIVRSALGPHTAIHNRFIRAIYTTAENQALVEENGPDWYKLTLPNKPKPAPQPQPAPSTGHRPNSTNSGEPPPSVVSPSHRARRSPRRSAAARSNQVNVAGACAGSAYTGQTGENDVERCVHVRVRARDRAHGHVHFRA